MLIFRVFLWFGHVLRLTRECARLRGDTIFSWHKKQNQTFFQKILTNYVSVSLKPALTHLQLIWFQNLRLVSPQRFCVSLRECPTRALNNNYALAADIDSKLTPRESSVILYFSSRVPRTSTEHRITTTHTHTQLIWLQNWRLVSPLLFCISLRECPTRAPKNNYALAIGINSKLTPRETQAILYLSSRVPRTSTEYQLRTRTRSCNWCDFKIDASWVPSDSVSLFASAPHEHQITTTHSQLIWTQNWRLGRLQWICIFFRECPARAPKTNYRLAIDMNSKSTPRESPTILCFSSRVPRTSTEEELHTMNTRIIIY